MNKTLEHYLRSALPQLTFIDASGVVRLEDVQTELDPSMSECLTIDFGQKIRPEDVDQILTSCHEYFAVHGFVGIPLPHSSEGTIIAIVVNYKLRQLIQIVLKIEGYRLIITATESQ